MLLQLLRVAGDAHDGTAVNGRLYTPPPAPSERLSALPQGVRIVRNTLSEQVLGSPSGMAQDTTMESLNGRVAKSLAAGIVRCASLSREPQKPGLSIKGLTARPATHRWLIGQRGLRTQDHGCIQSSAAAAQAVWERAQRVPSRSFRTPPQWAVPAGWAPGKGLIPGAPGLRSCSATQQCASSSTSAPACRSRPGERQFAVGRAPAHGNVTPARVLCHLRWTKRMAFFSQIPVL